MRLWGSSNSGLLTWSLPFLRFRCFFLRRCDFFADIFILAIFWSEAQVMYEESDQSADHRQVSDPLQRPFPHPHQDRDAWIARQPAVKLRLRRVVQHID